MSDFEARLVRSLVSQSLLALAGVDYELEDWKVADDVPTVVRHGIPQVLHDLKSVERLVRRHVPSAPCGADPA